MTRFKSLIQNNPLKKVSRLVCLLLLIGSTPAEAIDYSQMSQKELKCAFISAVKEDDINEIIQLLDAGVNPDTSIPYVMKGASFSFDVAGPAIEYAARHNRLKTVQILLKKTDNLNEPLKSAIQSGHSKVVKLLIESGANVNHRYGVGGPLTTAVSNTLIDSESKHAIVSLLLNAGANVNQTYDGNTALLEGALFNLHPKTFELLLKAGADIHQVNNEGKTALMLAAVTHHYEAVELLLEAYKNNPRASSDSETDSINLVDKDGNTALIIAIKKEVSDYSNPRAAAMTRASQGIINALWHAPGIDLYIRNKAGQAANLLLGSSNK